MNVLFEESGSFKAATVLTDAGSSSQVELPGGRRVKIKANAVLLSFAQPSSATLLPQAEALADSIDIGFLWECAPQDEFNFQQLARDYFGHAPSPVEATALLLKLHHAPVYFYRKGKGHYRPAPAETLQLALAGLARRQREAEQQAEWIERLLAGELPAEIAAATDRLLFNPDKNSLLYKALDQAAQRSHCSAAKLLLQVGALPSAYDLHYRRFLATCFSRGVAFPELPVPQRVADLPMAAVSAFSIDDETTTEIDDAFSVQWLSDGDTEADTEAETKIVRVGIHIAAPGLAIQPDDAVDQVARQRLSTVYMPGDKMTMLPEAWITHFTLRAGAVCPALSLYVDIDPQTYAIQHTETRVEQIKISDNLRHNQLDALVTEDALENVVAGAETQAFPHAQALAFLWCLTKILSAQRDVVRGKPENQSRIDYNFSVSEGRVDIVPRQRGAPLDKIVAELMIFTNSTWGALLAAHDVPGMYRAQSLMRQGFAKIFSTRMVTRPSPHLGLGVAQYAWSTSPLRRYADLVNQWQLLACIRGEPAPFKHGDAALLGLVASFDATYSSYAEFQQQMENYWCLQWLKQNQITHPHAHVVKEDLLRLAQIPFVTRLPGLATHPRGTEIVLEIESIDDVELQLHARCAAVLTTVSDAAAAEITDDDEDDAAMIASPNTLAKDAEASSSAVPVTPMANDRENDRVSQPNISFPDATHD